VSEEDRTDKPPELTPKETDAIAEVIVLHQAIRFLEERGFVVTKGHVRPSIDREEIERDAA